MYPIPEDERYKRFDVLAILDKHHASFGESLSLLALIFERAGNATETEAYRHFLHDLFPDIHLDHEDEPSRYIEKNFDLDKIATGEEREENSLIETHHEDLSTKSQENNAYGETSSQTNAIDTVDSQGEKPQPVQKFKEIPSTVQSNVTSSVAKHLNSSPRPYPSTSPDSEAGTFFIGIDLVRIFGLACWRKQKANNIYTGHQYHGSSVRLHHWYQVSYRQYAKLVCTNCTWSSGNLPCELLIND